MIRSAGCYLLRAEGFSCSLDVFYGGLGISKLKFLKEKKISFFQFENFSNFGQQNPGSGLDPNPVSDRYSVKNAGSWSETLA